MSRAAFDVHVGRIMMAVVQSSKCYTAPSVYCKMKMERKVNVFHTISTGTRISCPPGPTGVNAGESSLLIVACCCTQPLVAMMACF